jgi:phosphoadenosine phosphosulfate reductase
MNVVPIDEDIERRAVELEAMAPPDIVAYALEQYSPAIQIAFSGAEDVVLIDMASKSGRPFRVFCLDTGRLHAETYDFLERVRQRYQIQIDLLFPDYNRVEQLVREKGLFSFYRDGHEECCRVRKIEPLRRVLAGLEAWMTGQRRDQSPSTRAQVRAIEIDRTFSGLHGRLVKFNPLANWSSREVWSYMRRFEVPSNPLHNAGYLSIGCQPCTRPILPHQQEREGRWWWEEENKKECGLHAATIER